MNTAKDVSLKEIINGVAGLSVSGIIAWVNTGLVPAEFIPHQLDWLRAAAVIVIFSAIVIAFMLRHSVRRQRRLFAIILVVALVCVIGIRAGYVKHSGRSNYLVGFSTPDLSVFGKCVDFGDSRFACAEDETIAKAYGSSYWILYYWYVLAYLIFAAVLVALIVSIQIEERVRR